MQKLNFKLLPLLFLALSFSNSNAQLYDVSDIPIINGSDTLLNAYAGGFNTPQFSAIDLDNDGIDDLLVYDRVAQIAVTFINNGTPNQVDYTYAPEYMSRFPQGTRNFMLARDYDCDGIKDLFYFNQPLSSSGGIGVLKGSYNADDVITFTEVIEVLKYDHLGNGFLQNIFIYNPDLPSFADMDGDGDMDVCAFTLDFVFSRNIFYYKNMSAENGHGCDSLQMTLGHQCWGLVSEIGTNGAVLISPSIDSCAGNEYWSPRSNITTPNGEPRHTGSALTAVDQDGDGNMDMIMGDVSVNQLNLLNTTEINDTLLVTTQDSTFPTYNVSTDIYTFPAAYILDVDNDGVDDMIAAPNETFPTEAITDSVAWWYRNTSSNNVMTFEFQQKDFLVNTMVDLGHKASPAFFDYNADGLLDLVVGNVGYCQPDGSYVFGLHLYRNVGTATEPAFELIDQDYGGLSSLQLYDMHPTFGDLDGDGDEDLLLGESDGTLYYVENTAGAGNTATWGTPTANYSNIDPGDHSTPQLVDLDDDGDLDIVCGEGNGNINFFENDGSNTFNSTPTSQTIGLIDINTFGSGESAPHFVEVDGEMQLFLGHMLGGLIHMDNITGNVLGTYDTLSMQWESMYTGFYSKVATADLDGDDTLEVVMGNIRGGFSIYSITKSEEPDTTGDTTTVDIIKPISMNSMVNLFPNPAKDVLNISFEQTPNSPVDFRIYNPLGQLLRQKRVNLAGNISSIDIQDLAQGIYILEIDSKDYKEFVKFNIKR